MSAEVKSEPLIVMCSEMAHPLEAAREPARL
jgi:hypothetical protein